jgi:hypoxanthine-DNA glycosylase
MPTNKNSFPPVVGNNPHTLILGSMPGELSLQQQRYYAHPRNAFWPIMRRLFQIDESLTYLQALEILKQQQIALWDVLYQCQRQGSLDNHIVGSSIVVNDFRKFLSDKTTIHRVFFNGSKAESEFQKRVLPILRQDFDLQMQRLPSTSPAMASLNFEQKLAAWKVVKN